MNTWKGLLDHYLQKSPKPFRIDPTTFMRVDTPIGYKAFREAAMNLIIHQDYGDYSRKPVIKFFQDGIQFWNPGDAFVADADLLKPGEKDVRNPLIATAFRKLGLCERAGTGLKMIFNEW